MRIRLAALLTTLALLVPAAAAAQDGNPFDGQVPPAQPTPAPTVEPINETTQDDIGRTELWAIGGGLLAVFVGIGLWISRDARRSLPAGEREDAARPRDEGPHRHERQAKAKARAKGRAQRQARKAARKTRR